MSAQEFYTKTQFLSSLFSEEDKKKSSFHHEFYMGLCFKHKTNWITQENEISNLVNNYKVPPYTHIVFRNITILDCLEYEDDVCIFGRIDQDHMCISIEDNHVGLYEFGTNQEMLASAASPEQFLSVMAILAEREVERLLMGEANLESKDAFVQKLVSVSGDPKTERFYRFLVR